MKKKVLFLCLIVLSSMLFMSCRMSTEQLTTEVKQNMEEEFSKPEYAEYGIEVESLLLAKESGNRYSGVLKTKENFGDFTYTVVVIYDGKVFTWEVLD